MKNRKECRKSESWEEWRVTIKIGRNEEWKMKNVKYEVRRMRIKANWRVGNSCLDEKKKKISIFILICRDEQEGITKKKNPTNIQICSFSSPASFSSQMWCTDVLNDVL